MQTADCLREKAGDADNGEPPLHFRCIHAKRQRRGVGDKKAVNRRIPQYRGGAA